MPKMIYVNNFELKITSSVSKLLINIFPNLAPYCMYILPKEPLENTLY